MKLNKFINSLFSRLKALLSNSIRIQKMEKSQRGPQSQEINIEEVRMPENEESQALSQKDVTGLYRNLLLIDFFFLCLSFLFFLWQLFGISPYYFIGFIFALSVFRIGYATLRICSVKKRPWFQFAHSQIENIGLLGTSVRISFFFWLIVKALGFFGFK